MKKKRNTIIVIIAIAIVVGVVIYIVTPNTLERAQQIIEKQTPEAVSFVLEHEKELSVLRELRQRLDDKGYQIYQSGNDDPTFRTLIHSRIGPLQSFAECTDMSKEEKDAVYAILSALPVKIKDISIEPDFIAIYSETHFGFDLFSVSTVSLCITDDKNGVDDSPDREYYHYEQINDWFLGIGYWENG